MILLQVFNLVHGSFYVILKTIAVVYIYNSAEKKIQQQ